MRRLGSSQIVTLSTLALIFRRYNNNGRNMRTGQRIYFSLQPYCLFIKYQIFEAMFTLHIVVLN